MNIRSPAAGILRRGSVADTAIDYSQMDRGVKTHRGGYHHRGQVVSGSRLQILLREEHADPAAGQEIPLLSE